MSYPARPSRWRSTVNLTTLWTRVLLVLVLALCAVQVVRDLAAADTAHTVSGLLIAGYLAWLAWEVPVTFSTPAERVAESGTLAAYVTARMSLVVVAVLPSTPWTGWSMWMVPPIVLFAGGVALRLTAIRALGQLYTHHVLRREQHRLITTGPYRPVRHPAYTGMLLANLGFVLFFHHLVSVVAMVLLTAVLVWRIRTEERVLWSIPGYPEYATGRARVLPGVW